MSMSRAYEKTIRQAKLLDSQELDCGYYQSRWQLPNPSDLPTLGATIKQGSSRHVVSHRHNANMTLVGRTTVEAEQSLNLISEGFAVKPWQIYILRDAALFTCLELAQEIEARSLQKQSLVLVESQYPWPFQPKPSMIYLPDLPQHVIACLPLLDDKSIPSRLCHQDGNPGCFEDSAEQLAQAWLNQLTPPEKARWSLVTIAP